MAHAILPTWRSMCSLTCDKRTNCLRPRNPLSQAFSSGKPASAVAIETLLRSYPA